MEPQEKPSLASLRIERDRPAAAQEPGGKKKSLVGILLAVVLTALFFLVRGFFSSPTEVEAATVTITYPSQAKSVLTASGYVVAEQKASIASKGTGRLVYLGVEEGDNVRQGQVIARLEDKDVSAALQRSEADLDVARADSLDATRSYEREKSLYDADLVSKAELDASHARLLRTIATIRSAEAAVAEARVALENTRIRAPFDGTVLTKDADVGEVVAPFASSANSRAAVITMADLSSLVVEADVSESNITRVSPGQPCEIVLDAYPDIRYQGYVHKIVPTADRAKATVLTKVRFRERDSRVLPEMSAKVSFLMKDYVRSEGDTIPILTVPASSVQKRDGREITFLLRDDRALEQEVKTGQTFGDRLEIVAGLSPGDRIVLRPPPSLSDNDRVRVK